MSLFKFPKYRKGQSVMTPDGRGIVESIQWNSNKHWYEVLGKWFSEVELSA